MDYTFTIENLETNYPKFEPMYRQHYGEMTARLESQGISVLPYKPDLETYFASNKSGGLLHYVVRCDGAPIGYSNVYLYNNMHNGRYEAQEDTVYILPEHRNGIGRKLVKFILADLESRGVKQVQITPVTDLRVAKIWRRMGFKTLAELMIYEFKEH